MPELELVDDILAPNDTIKVRYEGKEPFKPVTAALAVLKDVLRITTKDTLSTDIRWDVSSEPRSFYGRWEGRRKEDRWSRSVVRIIIQGEQHSKERKGWVRIELKGVLETKFVYSNFIQRTFWFIYNRLFYYAQRRRYVDMAKTDMYEIRERFTRMLGISREEHLEG